MNEVPKLYWRFASTICLVLFMILGYIVKFYEKTVLVIDTPVLNFVKNIRQDSLTALFAWLTKFGNTLTIAFLVVVFVALLWSAGKKIESLWLIINTALISGIGNYVIKFLFTRSRPSITHLVSASHYSFPSGHAMAAMLLFGTLILLLLPYSKHNPWVKGLQALSIIFILLIGTSRVYLGVHYLSDILGGYLLGAAWLCYSYPIFVKLRLQQVFSQK